MPVWPAVADLIRSLPTVSRCGPSQFCRRSSFPDRHRQPLQRLGRHHHHACRTGRPRHRRRPRQSSITTAIVDTKTTGVIATARFGADTAGCRDAIAWVDQHTMPGERVWAIEGSASFGGGLTARHASDDEWVVEFDRAREKASKDGAKSDELDAIRAAREVVGRATLNTPRAHDGRREAMRVHTVARAGAVRARTAAINELKALVVTAPDDLRAELRGLTTRALVKTCARFRSSQSQPISRQGTQLTMRAPAQRIVHFNAESSDHDRAMTTLIDETAPQLLGEPGIGHVTAAPSCCHGRTTARSLLRTARRRGTDPRDVRPDPEPTPAQPWRRPTPRPHPLHRRHNTNPPRPHHLRLRGTPPHRKCAPRNRRSGGGAVGRSDAARPHPRWRDTEPESVRGGG